MNSPHQREQLPDLLSDALGPAERARVESHLARCDQCARELRALQRMQQTMAALPSATPPANLRANVRAALREDKKQRWALASLMGNRAKSGASSGARRALPFALPTRQLAWGGAVAVGAVGLMLLARPSLQNSPTSQMAPASETEFAERAAAGAPPAPDTNAAPTNAAKKPGANAPSTKIPGNAKSNASATATDGASGVPDSVTSLPPLAPFPTPRARIEQSATAAPLPASQTPLFEPAPKIAPAPSGKTDASQSQKKPVAPAPMGQIDADKSQKRPDAPASTTQAAPPTKSNPPTQAPLGRAAVPGQAPALRDLIQGETSLSQAPTNSETEDAPSSADLSAESAGAPDAARTRAHSRSDGGAAFAAPPMTNRPALAPAPVAPQKSLTSNNWAGGAVEFQLKRTDNQAPVLTLGVELAIGNARLVLLLPQGETVVWRGSMNAAPVEIKLPTLAGKARSGQKIRARLEQINGEGNPKGSTTFDLLWP